MTATDASGNSATASSHGHDRAATRPVGDGNGGAATLLWSPNKTMVPVTVSGVALGAGVTVKYSVKDEYNKVRPSGTAVVGANGAYAFVVSLEAYRDGGDARPHYTITVTTTDPFGRVVSKTALVRVPHDQK